MGFQLPIPQLVSLPDFWTINNKGDEREILVLLTSKGGKQQKTRRLFQVLMLGLPPLPVFLWGGWKCGNLPFAKEKAAGWQPLGLVDLMVWKLFVATSYYLFVCRSDYFKEISWGMLSKMNLGEARLSTELFWSCVVSDPIWGSSAWSPISSHIIVIPPYKSQHGFWTWWFGKHSFLWVIRLFGVWSGRSRPAQK